MCTKITLITRSFVPVEIHHKIKDACLSEHRRRQERLSSNIRDPDPATLVAISRKTHKEKRVPDNNASVLSANRDETCPANA